MRRTRQRRYHRTIELPKQPTYPPGHRTREGLRAALRDHGASSVLVRFRAEGSRYRLRSYRVRPENRPLPTDLAGRLRMLAQTMVDESPPRGSRHPGKQGTLSWTLETDRLMIGY